MGNIMDALKDTPIPTLLVVAGIVFLLLSIAGQLAGRIVVPPERQRQALLLGCVLVVVGIALHIAPPRSASPQLPAVSPGPPPKTPTQTPPGASPPPPPPRASREFPTKYDGVMAQITRFEKSGELIIVELTVRNTLDERLQVCAHSSTAKLIDQATGASWQVLNHGGDVSSCGRVGANQSSGMWMQFKIPNPENKTFSLSSDLFNRLVDNLTVGERP